MKIDNKREFRRIRNNHMNTGLRLMRMTVLRYDIRCCGGEVGSAGENGSLGT